MERINNFLSEWLYVISRTSFIIANWNGSRRCKTQISTRQWSLTMVIDKWISANIGAAQPYNFLTKYERPKRLKRWNEVYHGFACSSRYIQWRKTMITHIQCKLIEFCISEFQFVNKNKIKKKDLRRKKYICEGEVCNYMIARFNCIKFESGFKYILNICFSITL